MNRAFDIAMSRHGAMFFGDAQAAFTNVARALHPGGRLVLLTWQPFEHNKFMTAFSTALAAGCDIAPPSPDLPGPVSLSDPDRVHRLLTSAGFIDVRLQGLCQQMYFGPDPDDACRFIIGQFDAMVRDLDTDTRHRVLDNLRADMAAHHTNRGILYNSAAWLIQARRS